MNDYYDIYTIIGDKIDYTLSPYIYTTLFEKFRMRAIYMKHDLPAAKLSQFMASVKLLGIAGFNVTIPHKKTIVKYLDKSDHVVSATGSANLVINRAGVLCGYNTDLAGIAESIETGLRLDVGNKSIVIIGSGGAAATAYYYLVEQGANMISVYHRSAARGRAFNQFARTLKRSESYRGVIYKNSIGDISPCDLCINCTPAPIMKLMTPASLSVAKHIFEMRYGDYPVLGNNHLRGNLMLAAQAAANFKIMTGRTIAVNRIMKIIDEAALHD